MKNPNNPMTIRTIAAVSIGVAFMVLGIKYLAYRLTGSVAFYSDTLESIVNVLASITALAAIIISAKPADKEHPFGHHKAELFSATFEGALIMVAALFIVRESFDALSNPRTLNAPVMGLMINGGATLLNGAWSAFLINRGRKWRSPALLADGRHLLMDVWTSVGVFAGISIAVVTGWSILDPLLALAVAAYILWNGYHIVLSSLSGLLDEAASPEIQERVRLVIKSYGDGALQAHDIRTRHSGRLVFVEFHLVVPGNMSVAKSHRICDRIEAALEAEIQGTDIFIHVEPEHEVKGAAEGTIDL
jgi:cation diffusion facilitator family transporter